MTTGSLPLCGSELASPKYIPELDGIRGAAVVLVVWAHIPAGIQPRLAQQFLAMAQVGYLGVNLFFVLSGFLITRILLRDKARGFALRYFFIRRFLRIVPIYYLTLLIVGIAHPSWDIGWCAIYLSNFYFSFRASQTPLDHTWSLAVEEHFYLLWPAVVYCLSVQSSRRVIAWGVLPFAVVSAFLIVMLTPSLLSPLEAKKLIYFSTPCEAGVLGLGVLLAFAERDLLRAEKRPLLRFVLLGIAGIAVGVGPKFMGLKVSYDAFRLIAYGLISVSIVGLAIVLSRQPITWIFRTTLMGFIGKISYGLYLYHYPIFFFMKVHPADLPQNRLLRQTLLAIVYSLTAASVSFFVIERPLLRLKDRFEPK